MNPGVPCYWALGFLIVGTSCLAFILYTYLVDKRSLLLRDLLLFAFGAFMFGALGIIFVTAKVRKYSS